MDSNEKVLREAARMYDSTGGADVLGRDQPDLVGHRSLLAGMHELFGEELPRDLVERVRRIRAPSEAISVLLIGNHSAGKSSFVNWYVGEQVQTTSVAMETSGITVVRRGKKRTQWRGKMTLGNFPALESLGRLPGVVDHLTTEFSTSEKHVFRSIELIDTPGLVDGNVRYPFDVDAAMDELAQEASLILVFFDPINKALVNRCMKAVERLSRLHHAKMHYVLSKMDTVREEHDRLTVVSQVAQELQSCVKGTHALKITQIFLPTHVGQGVGLRSKQQSTCSEPQNQVRSI
jgi:GTPase SAR1 family protein